MTAQMARCDTDKTTNPLQTLAKVESEGLKAVNAIILAHMKSGVSLIPEIASYLIQAGGKRLRPLLTLASSRLCQYEGRHHVELAASVEFIHTATLLHDDVVDESTLRRGQETANHHWGNAQSILVGDYLFSKAFKLMVSTGNMEVLSVLANASSTIAEGEVAQLLVTTDREIALAEYIEIVKSKTAALFSAACEVSAILAQVPNVQRKALKEYGECLGIAFQLSDDVLDYQGEVGAFGKAIGDDFFKGKMTIPIIFALQKCSKSEKVFLKTTLENPQKGPEEFRKTKEILEKYSCFSQITDVAKEYVHQANQHLSHFPESSTQKLFKEIADFCIERVF